MKLSNDIVIHFAKELGFDLVGFSKAELLNDEIQNLKDWVEKNIMQKWIT